MAKRSVCAIMALGGLWLLPQCPSSTPPPQKTEQKPPPRADLALVSGIVETLDPALPKANSVAVKDGRIVAVGTDKEVAVWIGDGTKVIDLKGRTLVPGLVDSHVHLAGLGARRFGVDLVGTKSIEEVRGKVKKAISAAKKGEWILGRGWDQNDWESFKKKKLKFPTAKDLDEVSPDNPVLLRRVDGHAIWANSKAMQAAGVDAKTKAPSGGEIVKATSGKPSGIFVDNAKALIEEKAPPPTKEQLIAALKAAQKEVLADGLVQVDDMGADKAEVAALRELDEQGELRVRVYVFLDGGVEDIGALFGDGPSSPKTPSSRLTVRGVKFFVDGALGSRGALLLKPYNDDKKNSGLFVTKPEALEARIRIAAKAGFQVATHAIGDRGNQVVLDLYEKVFGDDIHRARPRIEHAQVLTPDDIGRFGKDGVIASMQPTHATSDMPWAEQRIGKERLRGAYAWRSLLARGATIACGSDAPVEDVSPVLGLYAAVARKDPLGAPEGGWMPEEKMTPTQALTAFTRAGAYASFREEEAGRVKNGFLADFTILDQDPLTASEDDLTSMQVVLTMIAGKVEFSKPGADAPPEPPPGAARAQATMTSSAAKTSSVAKTSTGSKARSP
jgi:predicted amidohydrolase YtcJ